MRGLSRRLGDGIVRGVFATERAVFLIWYSRQVIREQIPFSQVLLSFLHALRLDLSTASYILVVPFFLLFYQDFNLSFEIVNCLVKLFINATSKIRDKCNP